MMTALRSSFWQHAILVAAVLVTPVLTAQTGDGAATVTGKYLGNGKPADIRHVTVETREPFSDKEAICLVFSEKKPGAGKKASFDGAFGKLGSALIISVHQDGGIFGCEVSHSALQKSGFSSIGRIKMEEFVVDASTVRGRISTGGSAETFGETWEVDLTFSAPLPKGAFAPAPKPAPAAKKESEPEAEEKPTGPRPSVAKLPMPASATQVEYKELVEQITATCSAPVGTVADELSKSFKKQGWKSGPGELMGKMNAILKRTMNGAEVTIMVQPKPPGCTVKMMTRGLDWTETPDSTSAPAAAEESPAGEDPEAKAKRLINDALKSIGQ